jgi:hypothetical protein
VDIPMLLKLNGNTKNRVLRTVVYDADSSDLILERFDLTENIKSNGNKIMLKLPITPKRVIIETYGDGTGRNGMFRDKSFKVLLGKPQKLKSYNIDFGSGDSEYISFIERLSRDLPKIQPSDRIIKSPSGNFGIVVFDRLRSRSGEYINSPAMVHVKTGLIEVSKSHFMKMSQNQRIATLCHEYAHFYKNPLMGYDVKSEYGADLNGLTVYLAKGYGESEDLKAFRKTFNGHPTDQNRARWKLIKDFARKINNGEYFGKPYNLPPI